MEKISQQIVGRELMINKSIDMPKSKHQKAKKISPIQLAFILIKHYHVPPFRLKDLILIEIVCQKD